MKGLVIGVPPMAEQREIVAVLRALDDKIESNLRVIEGCTRILDSQCCVGGWPKDLIGPSGGGRSGKLSTRKR